MATTQLIAPAGAPTSSAPTPRTVPRQRSGPDRFFRLLASGAGLSTLVILALISIFLTLEGLPAFRAAGFGFLTEFRWDFAPEIPVFGVGSLLIGTIVLAMVALVLALPVAIGTALFINEYAPPRLAKVLTTVVDLLAAVPSLIYGMWGLFFLMPKMLGISRFLSDHLGFIPIFRVNQQAFDRSPFITGVVLGIMILPIITAVTREVFSQVPRATCEAALALGGTRWGMIRKVVLPFGRSGISGGAMLGLGRALGETIAITLLLGIVYEPSARILESNGGSIAAHIVLSFGEASDLQRSGLIAAGLVLFAVTLVVNLIARGIVDRQKTVEAR